MAACQSDDSDSETEIDVGAFSCDSDEVRPKNNFALDGKEMNKCLRALHFSTSKSRKHFEEICLTSTSQWSRKTSTACAAYKVLKIKRWLLTDVNLVFDPLNRNPDKIRQEAVLWPTEPEKEKTEPEDVPMVKRRSVDGVLAKQYSRSHTAFDNLRLLDEVLKEIDGPVTSADQHEDALPWLYSKGLQMLPDVTHGPFLRFFHSLLYAMHKFYRGSAPKLVFQNAFQQMVNCVAACIKVHLRIDCAPSMDGKDLDKLKLYIQIKNDRKEESEKKKVLISSRPDLFLYERTGEIPSRRVIAVVEVKGKAGDRIIHSDDEDEYDAPSLGVTDEDSEEELPVVEKLVKVRQPHMKRLGRQSRRYTKKFLPQLIGEMLCCFETHYLRHLLEDEVGLLLGIAVVGFDVYFVTLITDINCKATQTMLDDPENYVHVCITQPFNMCLRRDRRIIFKVLAAMCLIAPALTTPSVQSLDT